MSSIVKRLYDWADFDGPYGEDLAQLLSDAADRIEELEATIERVRVFPDKIRHAKTFRKLTMFGQIDAIADELEKELEQGDERV